MQCDVVCTCSSSKSVPSITQRSACKVEHLADHISFIISKQIVTNGPPLVVVIHLHPSKKVQTRVSGHKPYRNIGLFHCLKKNYHGVMYNKEFYP